MAVGAAAAARAASGRTQIDLSNSRLAGQPTASIPRVGGSARGSNLSNDTYRVRHGGLTTDPDF